MPSLILDRARSYLLPIFVLVTTWILIASTTPTFRGEASVFSVLEGFPLLGLVALGLAITIIAGELDLSVGSVAALAGWSRSRRRRRGWWARSRSRSRWAR